MWISPTDASYAFHAMFESQGELRGYVNLFVLDQVTEEDLKNPENPAHPIREMWSRGSAVAARLGIVYLAAKTEAYAADVVFELLEKRIRRVNQELLDQPMPHNMDEDIWNEIQLEESELNKDNPFHVFAEIAKRHIESERRHEALKTMIRVLEDDFEVQIQLRDTYRTGANYRNCVSRSFITAHRLKKKRTQ